MQDSGVVFVRARREDIARHKGGHEDGASDEAYPSSDDTGRISRQRG